MIYAKILENEEKKIAQFYYEFSGSTEEIQNLKDDFYKKNHKTIEEGEGASVEVIQEIFAKMGFTPISETFFYKN